jgi:hypothetical protein
MAYLPTCGFSGTRDGAQCPGGCFAHTVSTVEPTGVRDETAR